jgi:hypothetical protein
VISSLGVFSFLPPDKLSTPFDLSSPQYGLFQPISGKPTAIMVVGVLEFAAIYLGFREVDPVVLLI